MSPGAYFPAVAVDIYLSSLVLFDNGLRSQSHTTVTSLQKMDSPYYSASKSTWERTVPIEEETEKRNRHSPQPDESLEFISSTKNLPHPEKEAKGGEDAFFQTSASLGVFDGVSSWSDYGIDSGKYSRALAVRIQRYLDNTGAHGIIKSFKRAANRTSLGGSSTACIVGLKGYVLKCVNLGDSGVIVIRGNGIIFKSKSQQLSFNQPLQVSHTLRNNVRMCSVTDVAVRRGDIVVVASDGLWDNLYLSDIQRRVLDCFPDQSQGQTYTDDMMSECVDIASEVLAKMARVVAGMTNVRTPFSDEISKVGKAYQCGKMDDITVIVGIVVPL